MKKKSLIVIGIIVVISVITGVSYALWKTVLTQSGENIVKSDCFDITFEETEGIHLENSFPIYDAEGKKLKPYKVTITNHCSNEVDYQVNFETTNNTTMKDSYIKLMVNDNTPILLSELEETSTTISNGRSAYIIEQGEMEGNSSKEYNIRIWMDENVTQNDEGAMNGLFEGKVTVIASYIYTEGILHGTDPVLKEGLIPVTISDDGTVYKANLNSAWYSYTNQEWANAVILEDESIEYGYNEEIPEENIESYFVWIPRYKYQLFDLGEYTGATSVEAKEDTINVEFGTDTTDDANEGECTTPMTSGDTGNCEVGDYITHPAFLAFDVKGIWVGKFETGYKGATSKTGAQSNTNNPDKVQIKPNVYSWRNILPANIHLNAYNYKRGYDSHMMKNTEWGAVAYLQHSVYGSQTSVGVNSNSNYITGYAGTYNYTNPLSVEASTTNNYSGVYDMSGGAFEYIMAVMIRNGQICSVGYSEYSTGFAGPCCSGSGSKSGIEFPDEKYYDKYEYSTSIVAYNLRILGDATGEMGPFASAISSWHADVINPISARVPWLLRGGSISSGTGAGVFAQGNTVGRAVDSIGFRIVLAF